MSWNPQAGVVKDSTQRQNPSDSLAKALQASAPVAMLSPVRTDNSSLSSCQVWQSCADRTTNRSRQACACELLIHIVNHNYILVSFPTTKEGLQRHALDLDKWQEAYWDRGDDQMHYSRAGPIMMYWGSAVMSRSTVVKSCLRNLEGHRRKKKRNHRQSYIRTQFYMRTNFNSSTQGSTCAKDVNKLEHKRDLNHDTWPESSTYPHQWPTLGCQWECRRCENQFPAAESLFKPPE